MWLTLLEEAVDHSSKAAVAEVLGVSRTTISLVMSGKYPASTEHIEKKVLETYGHVDCPFLGEQITQAVCKSHHEAMPPTSSPRAMRFWRTCQGCEFNSKRSET